jgi:cytochrome c-type biogenesis protein CcmH
MRSGVVPSRHVHARVNTLRFLATLVAALLSAAVLAAVLPGEALDARLKALETDLRCLVCQNQTLAESNAPLAEDLRKEVRGLALAGKSDDEIRAYLVARYGDFVLYKPPFEPATYLLWLGPFVLLAAGALIWWMLLRRRDRMRSAEDAAGDAGTGGVGNAAVARARELLEE